MSPRGQAVSCTGGTSGATGLLKAQWWRPASRSACQESARAWGPSAAALLRVGRTSATTAIHARVNPNHRWCVIGRPSWEVLSAG